MGEKSFAVCFSCARAGRLLETLCLSAREWLDLLCFWCDAAHSGCV
jgi:hypothetical protein